MLTPLGADLCAECFGYGIDGSGDDCYLCEGSGRRYPAAVPYRATPLHFDRQTIWSPLLCDPATIERMTVSTIEQEDDGERLWSLTYSCGHVAEVFTFIGDFDYAKVYKGLKQVCWECRHTKGLEHMMQDLVSAEMIPVDTPEHNHWRSDGRPEPVGAEHDRMYPDCPMSGRT